MSDFFRGGTQDGVWPILERNVKRLETIAALAVLMRETERRLNQACEAGAEQVRSA